MYNKPAFTIEQQILQLRARGLIINEEDNVEHYLLNISYYRLAGYWWPMQSDKVLHQFKAGSKFSDVISLYKFDLELRLLIFEVIEKIEISLRSKMIYHLSHEFDPWWFQNTSIFVRTKELVQTLAKLDEELERSKDTFIREHNKKHKDDFRFPPAWKTLELTSLGALSKLYGNLKHSVRSKDLIAEEFGTVNHTYLPSWLQSITQIRNYCAHHSRLWNRNLPGRPKLLTNPPHHWIRSIPAENEFEKLYIHLCCMRYLLNVIQPNNTFHIKLYSLLEKYELNIDPNALGMKEEWYTEPLWEPD